MKSEKGITLIELLVVLGIFSVVMMGLYSSYVVMVRQGVREYRTSESEMELGISTNIILRDMGMAGFGLATDYTYHLPSPSFAIPHSVGAINDTHNSTTLGNPDTLYLAGTALGMEASTAQGWTYISAITGPSITTANWNDAREDVATNAVVVMMDPDAKRLYATAGGDWQFIYTGNALTTLSNSPVTLNPSDVGQLIYGLYNSTSGTTADQPYYMVKYYLGGTPPNACAEHTLNLIRAESRRTNAWSASPVINCVADFQVAFGLTTGVTSSTGITKGMAPNFAIDLWDNGGAAYVNAGGSPPATNYDPNELNDRLKQVRAYVLVQLGSRDQDFLYTNPDVNDTALYGTNKIRVGDLNLLDPNTGPVGEIYTLTDEQRHYRWRVASFAATPRNIR